MKKLLFLTLLFCSLSGLAFGQRFHNQKVIGYIPDYRDGSAVDYDNLTHAIFCFLFPKPDGSLPAPGIVEGNRLNAYLQATSASGTERLISLTNYQGGLTQISRNETATQIFCDTLVKYCHYHNFDGVDLDWEGLQTSADSTDYKTLIAALSVSLDAEDLDFVITVGFGDYAGQWYPTASVKKADWIQVMAYDAAGTWPQSPMTNHSSFDHLRQAAKYWIERGFEKDKLVLGVPFYGHKFSSPAGGIGTPKTYAEIVALYPNLPDYYNHIPVADFTFFNGPQLIRKKTEYIINEGFGGIFMWEMGQDATGSKSLHQQVICTYNNTCTPDALQCGGANVNDDLLAHWQFSGNTQDASGNGFHGLNSVNVLPATDRFGHENKAYQFAAGNLPSRIDIGTSAATDLTNFTFSAWIKLDPNSDNGIQTILQKHDSYPGAFAFFLEGKKLGVTFYDNSRPLYVYLLSYQTLNTDQWCHVAVTHGATSGTHLYINGIPDNEDLLWVNMKQAPSHQLRIGGGDSYFTFMGLLDDVRIYTRGLDACDIDSLYRMPDQVITHRQVSEAEAGLQLYPNPSEGAFTIKLKEELFDGARLVLSTTMGEKIMEQQLQEQQTTFHHSLPAGIYCLTLYKGELVTTHKLVIQTR